MVIITGPHHKIFSIFEYSIIFIILKLIILIIHKHIFEGFINLLYYNFKMELYLLKTKNYSEN